MSKGNEPTQIPVAGGKVATIDSEEFAEVSKFSWVMSGRGSKERPRAKVNGVSVYLHRFVMLAPKDVWVDHIDRNPMNNQKSNLRYCTPLQNAKNRSPNKACSSRFKGVRWHRATGKWCAAIKSDRKQIWLGVFTKEEEAAMAYDEAAIRLHGEYACTNRAELEKTA